MSRVLFKKVFTINNLQYKVVAFFLSVLLWVLVHQEDFLKKTVTVNVIAKAPEGFGIKGGGVFKKTATLIGLKENIQGITDSEIDIVVKLSEVTVGTSRIELKKELFQLSYKGIDVVMQEPFVDIFLDKYSEKVLPVKVSFVGQLEPGLAIKNILVKPDQVTVKGLESELKKMDFLYTNLINISGFTGTTTLYSSLRVPPDFKVEWAKRQVRVRVTIKEKTFEERK